MRLRSLQFINALPHLKLAMVLAFALAWCGLLIVVRTLWTWNMDYAFLVWNLGLGTVPLILSSLILWQKHWVVRLILAPVWLLFLPNAPYMITDFIHLRDLDTGPLWLDVLLVSSCAGTGLAMCYVSLSQIQTVFARARMASLGWMVTTGALFLSGFGIYLGRFLRWRTVDVVQKPILLLGDVADRLFNPLIHFRAWGVTLGFGVLLLVGYGFFVTIGVFIRTTGQTELERIATVPTGNLPAEV